MRCILAFGLLVTLTTVVCQDDQPAPVVATPPRPIGVIYLIRLLNVPQVQTYDDQESSNTIPGGNSYATSKLLASLAPNRIQDDKESSREKRSPGYGGGGGCNVCGGGGGGYPGGGGGGHGGGGGYGGGQSGSWATASSGSYGSGYGGSGGGKGKYGK